MEVPGTWRFVPREEALKRLQTSEGMAEIVASLPAQSRSPDAFVVEPEGAAPEAPGAASNLHRLAPGSPRPARFRVDTPFRRLPAPRTPGGLTACRHFAAGLVAVTFNTIRLQVLSQAAEIEVARLIGATDAFIRRRLPVFRRPPGTAGRVFAYALVAGGLGLLATPVAELAALYGGTFALRGPGSARRRSPAAAGAGLGWLGAQLSVTLSPASVCLTAGTSSAPWAPSQ